MPCPSSSGPCFVVAGLLDPFPLHENMQSHSRIAPACDHRRRLAFDRLRRDDLPVAATFQPGQLVRVNLAGLQAEGVMFQAAVTDAVAHIVKLTSEQPPTYLVKLLFSFRGVTEVEVPADRIHAA